MIETQRRAYLQVMGFDVWLAKQPDPELNRLLVQPGEGDTLLVCSHPALAAGRFAGDVARALDERVVWAWPDPEGRLDMPTLEDAVGQYLFTRVVIFGASLAGQLFGGDVPIVVGSARVLEIADLQELAASGHAKLAFWNRISGTGPS